MLLERLVETPRSIDVRGDEHQRASAAPALFTYASSTSTSPGGSSSSSSGFLVAFPRRFGLRIFSARSTSDDPAIASIGNVRADSTIAAGVTPFSSGVHALEVERAQLVLDERGHVGGEPRHLRLVVADDQIDGIRFSLRELLANGLGRRATPLERLEDGADDAAGEFGGEPIERVDVLAEERGGSVTFAVLETS